MHKTNKYVTRRDMEIFDFIILYMEENGYPPTVKEIGCGVGLSSASSVSTHLDNLEICGLIKRKPYSPRAIQILKNKNSMDAREREVLDHGLRN